MNDRHRRIYEAALRVLTFILAHLADFRDIPLVEQIKTDLTAATDTLTALGADKVTKTGAARDMTIHRGDARQKLTDLMQLITDMWKRIALKTGGDVNKFRMPRGGDQDILATAASYAEQAEPVKTEFTDRGFKENFIDVLLAAAAQLAETISETETARRERIGTNAAFDAPARLCRTLIEDLDPIVRMKYADNPRILAEWLVASHIQRPPQPQPEQVK